MPQISIPTVPRYLRYHTNVDATRSMSMEAAVYASPSCTGGQSGRDFSINILCLRKECASSSLSLRRKCSHLSLPPSSLRSTPSTSPPEQSPGPCFDFSPLLPFPHHLVSPQKATSSPCATISHIQAHGWQGSLPGGPLHAVSPRRRLPDHISCHRGCTPWSLVQPSPLSSHLSLLLRPNSAPTIKTPLCALHRSIRSCCFSPCSSLPELSLTLSCCLSSDFGPTYFL